MSQTETLLLVVLGFALATLIALFIGRLMWTAALKLGARRMQKQVPSSLVGLQTERDRLRAEYAMLSQRLGSRLEAAKIRMAEQMAEVSRHRNRLEKMEMTWNEREAAIQTLNEQVADLTSQLSRARAVEAEMQQTLAERQAELDQLRRQQPSSNWMGMSSGSTESPQPLASSPEDRLRQRIGKLTELAHTVAQDRQHPDLPDVPLPPVIIPPSDSDVIEKLAEAEQETGDLQRELEKLDEEWARQLDGLKEPEQPAEQAPEQGPTAVANVISLANRIRDLRKGLGPNS
jgi:chromosome segregation ATPase